MMAEKEHTSRIEAVLDLYENGLLESSDDALISEGDTEGLAQEARLLVAAAIARNKRMRELAKPSSARRRASRRFVSPVSVRPPSRQEGLRATYSQDSQPLDEEDESGEE
jgi:hypothetical protein